MSKLGIQWQRETNAVLEYNRLVLPRVLKSINCHSREFWQQLKDDNPNSIRIYRHFPNFDCWTGDPGYCAYEAVMAIKAEIGHILDLLTHVEDNNEWIHSFMHDDVEKADMYMEAFIQTAWSELGLRTVFLNSATGHWGDDIAVFHRALQAAERLGAVLGQHEYDYPTMDRIYQESGEYWLCGKWKKSMATIKSAGYKNIKCIITECSIDGGVADKPMKGWRSVPNALENYAASLLWYNDLLNGDEDVLGASIFGISMLGEWGDFDIEGSEAPARIAQFPKPEPPEPPNGGEPVIPDRIRIYDFDHGPHADDPTVSKEWLESIFGESINVHPVTEIHQPEPGDIVYVLEWINCKAGSVSVIIEVKDVNGDPVIGETVIFGWPNADPHGYSDKGWNWTPNGAAGDTEPPDGHVGPALSTGSYYSPDQGEKGPHFIWIWDHPSEMIDGVGMLASHHLVPGANHLHTEYGFRALRWGEDDPEPPPPPPEPPPPADGDLLRVAQDIRASVTDAVSLLGNIKAILLKSPPEDPEPPADQPLRGEYFNNATLGGAPVLVRAEEKPPSGKALDFDWGEGSPAPEVNSNDFSVRWTGKRTFEAKMYTFRAITDDGFRLWVDGQLLIDAWKLQPPTPYRAVKTLTAGQHDLKMEYFERGGGATCKLWWE